MRTGTGESGSADRSVRRLDDLADALRTGSRPDRWAAVWALGEVLRRGDRRALGPLREALNDPSLDVCAAARALLGAEPF